MTLHNFSTKVSLIWNIAELLRGSWKQHEYQDVILPFTVMKRLDSVLQPTKEKVLAEYNKFHGKVDTAPLLKNTAGVPFYNVSPYDFHKLLDDQKDIAKNLQSYINDFSPNVQEIIKKFDFEKHLNRLKGGNLLYLIIKEFNSVDLSPEAVSNEQMGALFEELIRKFSEQSNETAGEHYTPREVIEMMVEVMFTMDKDVLRKKNLIKTIYDPCCGTGGMLSISKNFIKEQLNHDADIYLRGQELNPVTYAVCKADMLIKKEDVDNIKGGEEDHAKASTLANDQFNGQTFDYILCNPPYGVDWKKDKDVVESEATRGYAGRFGAGTPRVSDGQLLFVQHMISKMKNQSEGGTRIAVVLNGSPLFTGDAGSGESEIRRWILENDWLEAIIALPDQLFYNTGISTYVWCLTNRKPSERKGKVQLIDAREMCHKMRKNLGNKRHEISNDDRQKIVKHYEEFKENKYSKIFKNTDFAFRQITVERPLRLNFQITPERIEQVRMQGKFTSTEIALDAKQTVRLKQEKANKIAQEALLDLNTRVVPLLEQCPNTKLYKNRDEFVDMLTAYFADHGLNPKDAYIKELLAGLSERDETADVCTKKNGDPEPDTELRDIENVPFTEDIQTYFKREVLPYVLDAWIDESKLDPKDGKLGIVGYEIPFTRHFYIYTPPRPLEEIESDIEAVENELLTMLKELT